MGSFHILYLVSEHETPPVKRRYKNSPNSIWFTSLESKCISTSNHFLLSFHSTKKWMEKNILAKTGNFYFDIKSTREIRWDPLNYLKSELGSISPTFYMQLLCTYVALAAFLCLRFRFVLYWCKTVGTKAARTLLMKLSSGVDFFNVL